MSQAIFHDGDLQSGIGRAISEQKLVLCVVVHPDDDGCSDCRTWEQDWLVNTSDEGTEVPEDAFGLLLAERAVLLKIEVGSKEATFLNAFCPVDGVPMLAVIQNGQVLEKLKADASLEEFRERLLAVCGLSDEAETSLSGQDGADPSLQAPDGAPPNAQEAEAERSARSAPAQSPSNVQRLLSERGERLEADRRKREADAKAERTARANARRRGEEDAAANAETKQGSSNNAERGKQQARDAWIYQQKQRKDEAKKERERILAQIESDKQERKAQKNRQKEFQQSGGAGGFSSMPTTADSTSRSVRPTAQYCSLVIRLFDGSSIRGKFASDTTLTEAVRPWIQEASPAGGADIPYTFREIRNPHPSRSIEISEEHQTLQDLELVPNATLVLVAVHNATSAYDQAGGGYLGTALNSVYWYAGAASSIVGTAVSYIPGVNRMYMGGTGDAQEHSNIQGARMAGSDSSPRPDQARVKTIFDQASEDKRKDQAATFYNGNSSAFQGNGPPRDDANEGT